MLGTLRFAQPTFSQDDMPIGSPLCDCPPSGTHRYFFRLYALKERLTLAPLATTRELQRAMQGKIVAHAELVGLHSHK
jgi:phosphatidylethanolamine-binding protein (PEBP) family uncharacterized protein